MTLNTDAMAYLSSDQIMEFGGVRSHVGVEDFAHYKQVGGSSKWVGTRKDGAQHAVRVVARCLIRARTIEAPHRRFFSVGYDLGLTS